MSRIISPSRGKEAVIRELKEAAKESDTVYLATDPDREGEAISLASRSSCSDPERSEGQARDLQRDHEERRAARASRAPREIDQNLVDAQQARRVLDRIVGYRAQSPLLWKKIRRGLSAGRVQSVATRLVVEREKEIESLRAPGILDARRAARSTIAEP